MDNQIEKVTNEHIETLQRCMQKVISSGLSGNNLQAYISMVKASNQEFITLEEEGML